MKFSTIGFTLVSALIAAQAFAANKSCMSVASSSSKQAALLKPPQEAGTQFDLTKSDRLQKAEKAASELSNQLSSAESRVSFLKERLDKKEIELTGFYGKKKEYSDLKSDITSVEGEISSLKYKIENGPNYYSDSKYADIRREYWATESIIDNIKKELDPPKETKKIGEETGKFIQTVIKGIPQRIFIGGDSEPSNKSEKPVEKKLTPEKKAELEQKLEKYKAQLLAIEELLRPIRERLDAEHAKNVEGFKAKRQLLKDRLAKLMQEKETLRSQIIAEDAADRARYKAELENIEKNELPKLKSKTKKINKELEEAREADFPRIRATFTQMMKNPATRTAIRDLVGYYSVRIIPKENKVTLLIGNNYSEKISPEKQNELETFIKKLVERQYYIVFDADSNWAQLIGQLAGEYGIAVSANGQPALNDVKVNKVNINNDYLRMKIFGESEDVIASPDSITGVALMLEKDLTHIFNLTEDFTFSGLRKWVDGLESDKRNLGVTVTRPDVVEKNKEFFKDKFNPKPGPNYLPALPKVEKFKTFQLIDSTLDMDGIFRIAAEALSYISASKMNDGTAGAVIFGSSKEDSKSSPLIYETSYKLAQVGYPVATGGSGGAMRTANRGAFNAGGVSIGIPIGGKDALESEKDTYTDVQSVTIKTRGYEERIPVLLGDGQSARKLIIFAPGGNGTIKELAVTLVRAAAKPDTYKVLVFLDKEYYQGLVDWLKAAPLPKYIKDRIGITDKAEDVERVARFYQDEADKKRERPTPRKDEPNYVAEEKKYKSSSFTPMDFDDYGGY